MAIFQADTHYGDLKGSVAADKADVTSASRWLAKNNHISEKECLVGLSMDVNIIHEKVQGDVDVKFLIASIEGYSNVPEMIEANDSLPVRALELSMSFTEFFVLFKRFGLTLSTDNLLEGKEYRVV